MGEGHMQNSALYELQQEVHTFECEASVLALALDQQAMPCLPDQADALGAHAVTAAIAHLKRSAAVMERLWDVIDQIDDSCPETVPPALLIRSLS
jgi:hypothetical protein